MSHSSLKCFIIMYTSVVEAFGWCAIIISHITWAAKEKTPLFFQVNCLLPTKMWCLTLHKLLRHLGGVLCILNNMVWVHCKYWFVQLEYVLWSLSVNHKYCQLRFQHLLVSNTSCFLWKSKVVLMLHAHVAAATAFRLQEPNSWTYNFVEVFRHNIESSQTWGIRKQCLLYRPVKKIY